MLVPALSPGSNVVVDDVEDGSSGGSASLGAVEPEPPEEADSPGEEEPEPLEKGLASVVSAWGEPKLSDVPEPFEEPPEEPVPPKEPAPSPAAGVVGMVWAPAGLCALVAVER
jgi:hypothetical protein